MPSQHRKARGYASQRIVADYLAANGWPYAQSTGAGRDGSDVTGVLDLDVEVKGRRGFDPLAAMRQQADRADGRLPFAVLRMDGQGEASIGAWPVVIRLDRFVELLRAAGYGDGPERPMVVSRQLLEDSPVGVESDVLRLMARRMIDEATP